MSETALIALDNNKQVAAFTGQALVMRETALTTAALIGQVTNAEENQAAVDAQSKLADLRRIVEKARKEAKEPVLEFGRKIDATAKAFIEEVSQEEMRITALLGDFFQLQESKRKAAERAAQLELERIEKARRDEEMRILREQQEREAAARREAQAVEAKLKAEQAAIQKQINDAKNAEARKKLEAEAAKQREEAERAAIELKRQQELAEAQTHAQLDAAQERASNAQAAIQTAPVAPVRAEGQTVKPTLEVTVTDIHKLYRFHPNCVKLEPLISEIKALVNAGATVAGVTVEKKFVSQTRSQRAPAAIDV